MGEGEEKDKVMKEEENTKWGREKTIWRSKRGKSPRDGGGRRKWPSVGGGKRKEQ